MTTTKTTRISHEADTPETVDFGLQDKRGRAIGCIVYRATVEYIAHPDGDAARSWSTVDPGVYFSWTPQATRNGSSYGATQSANLCKTELEREQAIEKYLKAARKRAAK